MIEVSNLSFKYPGQQEPVFTDFSLRLEQNKVYGLLGKNGTGKSTLLYLIDCCAPWLVPCVATQSQHTSGG